MLRASLFALLALGLSDGANVATVSPCSCSEYVLDCSNHNATTLSRIPICTGAATVKLEGNHLEAFPDGLNTFEVIHAGKNRITRLPSSSQLNPETRTLELHENRVGQSSHEFNSLSSLRRLRLENNRLTSLDFLPLQCNLFSLDVSENAISSLSGPLNNCSDLTFLALSDNQITIIPRDLFSKMKKLKFLYLYNNRIVSIPDGIFSGLKALNDLSLQMNRNVSLSSGSFQGLSLLRTLDLGFNNIQSLPTGVFSHTPALVKLDLIVNKLTELNPDVFAGLNSLEEILLWDNQLTAVPTLRNCCGTLTALNLLGNNISAPSEAALRNVLRGRIITKIGKVSVRPEVLRWALNADDITTFVEGPCRCGGLRKGAAKVHLCVDTTCGDDSANTDWVAALRALSST